MRTGRCTRPRSWLVLAAVGDSLLGEAMAEALGLPREKARELARQQLIAAAAGSDSQPRT